MALGQYTHIVHAKTPKTYTPLCSANQDLLRNQVHHISSIHLPVDFGLLLIVPKHAGFSWETSASALAGELTPVAVVLQEHAVVVQSCVWIYKRPRGWVCALIEACGEQHRQGEEWHSRNGTCCEGGGAGVGPGRAARTGWAETRKIKSRPNLPVSTTVISRVGFVNNNSSSKHQQNTSTAVF